MAQGSSESGTAQARLAGRQAIVTGASSGIGYATARALLDAGASVVAVGRRAERLRELQQGAADPQRLTLACGDLNDETFCDSLAAAAPEASILVNAAGVLQHTPFLDGDPAAWAWMWQTNVQSLLRLTQQVARNMAARKSGHIVNVTSILAGRVYPYTMVYAATKHATRAISQGLRIELHTQGIKVTEVAPGLVRTEILRELRHPDVVEAYRKRPYEPLRPQQVAATIVEALAAEGNACLDLIEINPAGQV